MVRPATPTYTAAQAAEMLDVNVSRILQLCRKGRLGYMRPKHGKCWIITQVEIDKFLQIGPLPAGRPKGKKNTRKYTRRTKTGGGKTGKANKKTVKTEATSGNENNSGPSEET